MIFFSFKVFRIDLKKITYRKSRGCHSKKTTRMEFFQAKRHTKFTKNDEGGDDDDGTDNNSNKFIIIIIIGLSPE